MIKFKNKKIKNNPNKYVRGFNVVRPIISTSMNEGEFFHHTIENIIKVEQHTTWVSETSHVFSFLYPYAKPLAPSGIPVLPHISTNPI